MLTNDKPRLGADPLPGRLRERQIAFSRAWRGELRGPLSHGFFANPVQNNSREAGGVRGGEGRSRLWVKRTRKARKSGHTSAGWDAKYPVGCETRYDEQQLWISQGCRP